MMRGSRGFTTVEVLFASAMSVLLFASIFQINKLLENSRFQYAANIELTSKARQTLDKIIFGNKTTAQAQRRGLMEAASATVTSTQVVYADAGGVQHTVRLNNGNIEYRWGTSGAYTTLFDPNGAASYDASKATTSLSFTQTNPRAVTIRLSLGKKINGRWYYGSVSSQVSFRNSA